MTAAAMAVATPFLAACSSEENLVPSCGVAVTDAHIVINVEPYGITPTAAKSRAAVSPAATNPDTVFLANGMRAVVSMEEDAPEPQTAATRATMDDGHYTIFALDPATGERITGINTQLTGTVAGGVFTSDAGSKMLLEPGTYKFVCINDAVTDHGTWLEVKTGSTTTNYGSASDETIPSASDAQIGTATETISGDDWKVTFLMKHQNARFRIRFVAYTDHLENLAGALTGYNSNYPIATKYALDGSSPVITEYSPSGYSALAKMTFPNLPTENNTAYIQAHNFYSNYMYITPMGTTIGFYLGVGKAYGVSYNLASPVMMLGYSNPLKYQRNHSYTITYRLLPRDLYLFQDGSCGALAEKGSRTAIAAVVKEKTATEDGLAIALKDAASDVGGTVKWGGPSGETTQQFNHIVKSTVADVLADMDGYKYTWEAAGSLDGVTIKANNPNMDAFYKAANHTSPAPITFGGGKRGKWFLPSVGQWILALKALGKTTTLPTDLVSSGSSTTTGNVDIDYMNRPFTAAGAGGNKLAYYWYWASTQYYTLEACSIDFVDGGTNTFKLTSEPTGRKGECVRAFIYF